MTKYAKSINKKYQIIIFDLDGVILNSKENMKLSWNDVKTLQPQNSFSFIL